MDTVDIKIGFVRLCVGLKWSKLANLIEAIDTLLHTLFEYLNKSNSYDNPIRFLHYCINGHHFHANCT